MIYLLEIKAEDPFATGETIILQQTYFSKRPTQKEIWANVLQAATDYFKEVEKFGITSIQKDWVFPNRVDVYAEQGHSLRLRYLVTPIEIARSSLESFLTHKNPEIRRFAKENLK